MDFTDAALLISAVFALTTIADKAIAQLTSWKLQIVNELIGVAVTFLVAYSTYANTVSVGGIKLDKVNTAGLVLIGLMIAGGATIADRTFSAIKNVGENQDPS